MTERLDVIGGGQTGLAVAYYLRRGAMRFVGLDQAPSPGDAWLHVWEALRLFSPALFTREYGRLFGVTPPATAERGACASGLPSGLTASMCPGLRSF